MGDESSLFSQMAHLGAAPEAAPILESAVAEIRSRVLGRRVDKKADGPLTPKEQEEVHKELRDFCEIDLNNEQHVASLEDPALRSHMEAARRRLAEHEQRLKQQPHVEFSRTNFVGIMRRLSELLRTELENMPEKELIETGFHQIKLLKQLGSPTPELNAIAGKLTQVVEAYEKAFVAGKTLRQSIFVIRRDCELFGETLISHVEILEEYNRRIREVFAATPASG